MKFYQTLIVIILIFVLVACENKIIDIPTIEEVPVIVPTEEREALPDEASTFILYYNFHKTQFEEGTKYEPGTYVRFMDEPTMTDGYKFAVVVIDQHGHIGSVYLDETYSSKLLYKDSSNNLYTFVEGTEDNPTFSYRLVDVNDDYDDYPTLEDSLEEGDLVVGQDEDLIRMLSVVQVNETKRYLGDELPMYGGLTYEEQMQLIEEKISNEQSIYGFDLYKKNKLAKTTSIEGVTVDLKHHLQLVKDILDIDAKLQEETLLLEAGNHSGEYHEGTYVGYSRRVLDRDQIYFGVAIASIDEHGILSGLYLDETADSTLIDNTYTTKVALDRFIKLENESYFTWKDQSEMFQNYVVEQQSLDGLSFFSTSSLGKIFEEQLDSINSSKIYTDSIDNVTIRVDLIAEATDKALALAEVGLPESTEIEE